MNSKNINNKYCNKSRQLFIDTDCLICETKTEFISDKEFFDFNNYSIKSK